MRPDVKINDLWMFAMGWLREEIDFPTPQSQTNTVVVPGRNAPIRFTEALGRVSYQPRSFSITLSMLGSREKFNQRKDILANLYAGQLCHVILSEEPELYAVGTLELEPAYDPLTGKGQMMLSLSLIHIFQTSSGDRKIPVVASKGTASWIDEEGAYTESDDSFAQVSIGAYKLGTMIKVSEELLNDSVFDLESYIAREFARRIGTKEEEAFFTGDGTGKPLGILAASGGAETGVTAASATAVTADELMDLFYSLKSPYRKNAVWILNDSTIKAIRKLKDNNGQYLWQPSLVAGTPDTILGRPVKTSAYMPAIAAGAKTIAFGDFSYYWIADRQGRSFKRLNELYAANGQVGFLGSQRVDGKMILPEAVKVLVQKAGSAG